MAGGQGLARRSRDHPAGLNGMLPLGVLPEGGNELGADTQGHGSKGTGRQVPASQRNGEQNVRFERIIY